MFHGFLWRRWLFRAALVAGCVGLPASAAWAWGRGHGHGHGHGWHGGRGGGQEGAATVEQAQDHAARMADFALDRVSADDNQRSLIKAELRSAVADLYPLRDEAKSLREDARAAMRGEQVDAAKLEEVRQRGLGLADQASKRVVALAVTVGNLLKPDQRASLLDMWQERREERREERRGGPGPSGGPGGPSGPSGPGGPGGDPHGGR